eukprot:TRINITY_DN1353_c0_g1_i1.p1 TRINITY_DN1353_c0_g1~~TRINITY_DN1353_c0_g1_i1.p1  ORF type:complete len:680 (-),score=130.17 TRINITY_DN1353_c0_g1_i1:52-2061(-)
MSERTRASFFSAIKPSSKPDVKKPSDAVMFRCGLLNIHGSDISLPTSVQATEINAVFRFVLDGRVHKTPVVRKLGDTRFSGAFEFLWQCSASQLASKELKIDFALCRGKAIDVVGQASIDALALATGPVKWQLELFSREKESLGFINFDFHMEQFISPTLHLEFTLVPDDGTPVSPHLFPETVQLPVLSLTKIKNLPKERWRSLDSNTDKFVVDTKFEASLKGLAKGGLLVIMKPKVRKASRDPLSGSYFRIPLGEIVPVEAQKVITHRATLANQGKIIGHALASCSWSTTCTYVQMVDGYYNSRAGIVGATAVPGAHDPVIKGETQQCQTASLTVAQVIEVGPVANIIPEVESGSDDDFNMTLPAGWEEERDPEGKIIYRNFISGHTQYNHPMKPSQESQPQVEEKSQCPKRPMISSKPSQMFSGFSNQVDEIQIKEAKKHNVDPKVRETIDDDWAVAGSDADDDIMSATSCVPYPYLPSPKPSTPPARPATGPRGTPPSSAFNSQSGANPFATASSASSQARPQTPPVSPAQAPRQEPVNPFATEGAQATNSTPVSPPASPPVSPVSPPTPTSGVNPFLTMLATGASPNPSPPFNPFMTVQNPMISSNPMMTNSNPMMTNSNPMMTNSNPMMTNGANPFLTIVPNQTQPQTQPPQLQPGNTTPNPFM